MRKLQKNTQRSRVLAELVKQADTEGIINNNMTKKAIQDLNMTVKEGRHFMLTHGLKEDGYLKRTPQRGIFKIKWGTVKQLIKMGLI